MIGAPVGIDQEVGVEVRPCRLDEDVDARRCRHAAVGLADDPAHRVAGRDRPGADQLLARLQGDVGDLAGRGIDLVERALGVGIDLDRIQVVGPHRLHASGAVGFRDAQTRVGRLRRRMPAVPQPLQLAGQRQRLRDLNDLHGLWRVRFEDRLARRVVVADRGRLPGRRASTERSRGEQCGNYRKFAHQPRSFDQLRART